MLENTFGSVRYAALPSWFMFSNEPDAHINVFARLYTYLIDNAKLNQTGIYEKTSFSQNEIAQKIKCSRMSVSRNLKTLESLNLIEIIKSPGKKSEYKILDITKSKLVDKDPDSDLLKPYKKIKSKTNVIINSENKKTEKEDNPLTEEQVNLKYYIENKTHEKLTKNKIHILWNAAINNPNISDNSLSEKIKSIVDYIIENYGNIKNYFGYIKKCIKKFKEKEYRNETECSEMAKSLKIKLENEYPKSYHLSANQCDALFAIINKKIIQTNKSSLRTDQFLISEVINKTRHITGINDMYQYLIKIISNYKTDQPELKKKKYINARTEQSYDINEFNGFAVTFSGNTLGTGIPEGFNNAEQSYDIDKFEELAITLSKNVPEGFNTDLLCDIDKSEEPNINNAPIDTEVKTEEQIQKAYKDFMQEMLNFQNELIAKNVNL